MKRAGLLVIIILEFGVPLFGAGEAWILDQGGSVLSLLGGDGAAGVTVPLPGEAFAIATAADGSAWVALGPEEQILRVDPQGGIAVIAGSGAAVLSLAVAADGSLWAVRPSADEVAHYSAAGVLLGVHPVGSVPYGIAIDPEGRVWVSNSYGNSVSRLAADGSAAGEFPVGFFPTGIAAHPDGSIWVVEKEGLSRLDGDGNLLASLQAGVFPAAVAIDLGGGVWVTNQSSHDVSRFTAAGIPLGEIAVGARPFGIAAAGDGSVLVLCRLGGEVLRLDGEGAVIAATPFDYPHAFGDLTGLARALTVDPGGDADGDGVASAVEAGLGFDPLDDASHPAIFLRGDVDLDGVLGLEDALGALAFLFLGEGVACQEALDVNDDHHLDLADPAQLLGFIFGVGPAPADPFPVAGPDPDPEGGLPCAGEAP